MTNFKVGFLLLVTFLVGCAARPSQTAPNPTSLPTATQETKLIDKLDGAIIIYGISGGIAGRSDVWTAYGDGRFVAADGSVSSIDQDALGNLLSKLDSLGIFDLKISNRPFELCADCFMYKLLISYDGRTVEVTWHDGDPDLPTVVGEAQNLIDGFLVHDPPIMDQ